MGNAMSEHHSNESRIMNTSSSNMMFGDEVIPVHKDRGGFFEKWKQVNKPIKFLLHHSRRPTEAIRFRRTTCHRPELDEILCCQKDRITPRKQYSKGIDSERMMRRLALNGTEPDIGIAEIRHHQSYIWSR